MNEYMVLVPSGGKCNLDDFMSVVRDRQGDAVARRVIAIVPRGSTRNLECIYAEQPAGPFNFSATMNVGLALADPDQPVIYAGDDVTLGTRGGFDQLALRASSLGGGAIVHAAVDGNRFNHPELKPRGLPDIFIVPRPCPLPMICCVIPPVVRKAVGPFDETFSGYGYEDHDYIRRAENLGFGYVVDHGVEVHHSADRSLYRKEPKFIQLGDLNRRKYFEKWGEWPQR